MFFCLFLKKKKTWRRDIWYFKVMFRFVTSHSHSSLRASVLGSEMIIGLEFDLQCFHISRKRVHLWGAWVCVCRGWGNSQICVMGVISAYTRGYLKVELDQITQLCADSLYTLCITYVSAVRSVSFAILWLRMGRKNGFHTENETKTF